MPPACSRTCASTRPGGRLVVTVIENPVINRVAFEGNSKLKDDQLANEVQSKSRGTLSRPTVQADVQRIVEIYRRNGRFDARVEPKIIELPNNRVDLVFEIKEADKTGVKKIIFVGNKAYGDQRLLDEIKTNETSWFWIVAFFQSADIYDPDRIEADRDLIRRFYLKHGYADVRVVSAVSVYDPAKKGFIVTFTLDEGARYRFGKIDIQSNVPQVDPNSLYSRSKAGRGDVYNAEAVEKSVENMSIEVARRGYPFAVVRPRGDRDLPTHTINVTFTVEDGPRVYIERINIRNNTRTRDYVIRREFDIGEGDAYNRALIDRAERRLKNLNYFKNVKITNEPGSAPDRVVLNVDVEEIPTGEFSISGGYSTASGWMAELSVSERNLLGQGQYARVAVQYGQYARGFELSFAEPFFMGNRLGVGLDLYAKQTLATNYISYNSQTLGVATRAGFALSEELSFQARYNIYSQKITLPYQYNDCQFSPNALIQGGPGVNPTEPRAAWPRMAVVTPTAKPRLPSAKSSQRARFWSRCSGTRSPTTRSTTTGTRPPAFTPNSSRTSPASAATSTSFARPSTPAATTRCSPTLLPCSICRAAISPAGAARTSACWIISRWDRTWSAASHRPVLARAILRPAPTRIRWAAPCTGAPALRRRRRSPSCPRTPASRARSSPTPARSGITKVRPAGT